MSMATVNTASSATPVAVYLWAGGEIVANVTMGYYYFQDARGNVTHLTNSSNVLIERYTYDLNGTVGYFDGNVGNGNSMTSSSVGNRFLFAGTILLPEANLYDMRNRMYFPRWGRFLQTDPIGFQGDASNLYRYCHNDPEDFSDPMGTYAQGLGWNKEDWNNYQSSQEQAASITGGAADRIENALKNGGKDLNALKKDFERVYGPGSATEAHLRQVGNTLRGMETALRDNGKLGYYANAKTNRDANAHGGSKDSAAWTNPSDKHTINVNTQHPTFGKPALVGSLIHETGHNFGLIDAKYRGATAYSRGNLYDQAYFKQLPFKEPEKALQNADHMVSFMIP
jgi:RHS repeat-associated protein